MSSPSHEKNTIHSTEKSSHWMMIIIGLVFILVIFFNFDDFVAKIDRNNFTSFFVFIFPIIGVVLIYKGISARRQFLIIGPMPLKLSPNIGQIGGDIGGEVFYNHPWQEQPCLMTLTCTHTISEGHGDDVSTQSNIVWQRDCSPAVKPSEHGCTLQFCFAVDALVPTNDSVSEGRVQWVLTLESQHNQQEFTRRWTIPVEKGELRSSIIISEKQVMDDLQLKQAQAEDSIKQQINISENDSELYVKSSAKQIKIFSLPIIMIGIIATAIGVYLLTKILHGASVRSEMAPFLTIAGLLIAGYGLFLNYRQLECKILGQTVYVRRKIFGRIVYKHQGVLNSTTQLYLNKNWTNRFGHKRIDYLTLTAKVVCDDGKTRNLKLVENIEGRLVAEALQQKIAHFISS